MHGWFASCTIGEASFEQVRQEIFFKISDRRVLRLFLHHKRVGWAQAFVKPNCALKSTEAAFGIMLRGRSASVLRLRCRQAAPAFLRREEVGHASGTAVVPKRCLVRTSEGLSLQTIPLRRHNAPTSKVTNFRSTCNGSGPYKQMTTRGSPVKPESSVPNPSAIKSR